MGQTRTDTHEQLAAKRRGAEARRCPSCKRGNAMSDASLPDVHTSRQCRYCGYARGFDHLTGEPFEELPDVR